MTRVVCLPPPQLFNERHTFYAGARVMGVVEGDRSLWGGGLIAVPPFPLVGSLIACPEVRITTLAGSSGTPPRRVRPCPLALRSCTFLEILAIKSQKDLDDLMGEPPGFFSTHLCDVYSPTSKNWHLKS